MDVKLGELGTWVGGRDFSPNGIISAIRRGEDPKKKPLHRGELSATDFGSSASASNLTNEC